MDETTKNASTTDDDTVSKRCTGKFFMTLLMAVNEGGNIVSVLPVLDSGSFRSQLESCNRDGSSNDALSAYFAYHHAVNALLPIAIKGLRKPSIFEAISGEKVPEKNTDDDTDNAGSVESSVFFSDDGGGNDEPPPAVFEKPQHTGLSSLIIVAVCHS